MESKFSCQRWCKFEWVGPVALEWAVRPLSNNWLRQPLASAHVQR